MSQTLTISDELYNHLKIEALESGLKSVELLLEKTHKTARQDRSGDTYRQDVFDKIEALQKHLSATLGVMPDSADLIREDRER